MEKKGVRPSVWTPGRRFRAWEKGGLIAAFLALGVYSGYILEAWQSGSAWAYATWWGADAGVFPLIVTCALGAFAWIILLWRHVLAHFAPIKRLLKRNHVEFFDDRHR